MCFNTHVHTGKPNIRHNTHVNTTMNKFIILDVTTLNDART